MNAAPASPAEIPRLSARWPVAALSPSAIPPYSAPAPTRLTVAASSFDAERSASAIGATITSVSHVQSPSSSSPASIAAAFSATTRLRRTGVASRRSIVPASSSPAIARAPRPTPKLIRISGPSVEKICPCR